MINTDELNVKEGDRVIYRNGHYTTKILTVDKVTPTGRIKIGTSYYDKRGFEITSDIWHRGRIHKGTEAEILKVEQDEYVKKLIYRLNNINIVTYEQAVSISAILDREPEGAIDNG
jgi:hypothetical protein